MADNVSLAPRRGVCRVWDADSGETLLETDFEVPANANAVVGRIRVSHGDQRLFLIEWTADGARGVNHYPLGKPPFSLATYRRWLGAIAALDGSFRADEVGK